MFKRVKRSIFALITFSLLFGFGLFSSAIGAEESAGDKGKALFDKAVLLIEETKFDEALKLLETLTIVHPDSEYVEKAKKLIASFKEKPGATPPPVKTGYDRLNPKIVRMSGTFKITECGSLIDPIRGLEWYVGQTPVTWNGAKTWAENLDKCDGGWNMPNQAELGTLRQGNVDSMRSAFGLYGEWVWGEENFGGKGYCIKLLGGSYDITYSNISNSDNVQALAVRFQKFRLPKKVENFELRTCGEIADANTGFAWYPGPDRDMTWQEAKDWVASLNACGANWRMPTIGELETLSVQASQASQRQHGSAFPFFAAPLPALTMNRPSKVAVLFQFRSPNLWSSDLAKKSMIQIHRLQFKMSTPCRSNIRTGMRAVAVRDDQ